MSLRSPIVLTLLSALAVTGVLMLVMAEPSVAVRVAQFFEGRSMLLLPVGGLLLMAAFGFSALAYGLVLERGGGRKAGRSSSPCSRNRRVARKCNAR